MAWEYERMPFLKGQSQGIYGIMFYTNKAEEEFSNYDMNDCPYKANGRGVQVWGKPQNLK